MTLHKAKLTIKPEAETEPRQRIHAIRSRFPVNPQLDFAALQKYFA